MSRLAGHVCRFCPMIRWAHIVDQATPEDLAAAIESALTSQAALSRGSNERPERRFYVTLEEMAARTTELYRRLAYHSSE